MIVLVYVDARKQVGDSAAPRRPGSGEIMRQLFQGRANHFRLEDRHLFAVTADRLYALWGTADLAV
jgi:hypothetical protein